MPICHQCTPAHAGKSLTRSYPPAHFTFHVLRSTTTSTMSTVTGAIKRKGGKEGDFHGKGAGKARVTPTKKRDNGNRAMDEENMLKGGDEDEFMEDAELVAKAREGGEDNDEEEGGKESSDDETADDRSDDGVDKSNKPDDNEEEGKEPAEKETADDKSDASVDKSDKPDDNEEGDDAGKKKPVGAMFSRMTKKGGNKANLKQQTLPKAVNGGFNDVVLFTLVAPHKQHQTKKESVKQAVYQVSRHIRGNFGTEASLVTVKASGGKYKSVSTIQVQQAKKLQEMERFVFIPYGNDEQKKQLLVPKSGKKEEKVVAVVAIGSNDPNLLKSTALFELTEDLGECNIQLIQKKVQAVNTVTKIVLVNAIPKHDPTMMNNIFKVGAEDTVADYYAKKSAGRVGFNTNAKPEVECHVDLMYAPGDWNSSVKVNDVVNKKVWVIETTPEMADILLENKKFLKDYLRQYIGRYVYVLKILDLKDDTIRQSSKTKLRNHYKCSTWMGELTLYLELPGFRAGGIDKPFKIRVGDNDRYVSARQILMDIRLPDVADAQPRFLFLALMDTPTGVDAAFPNGEEYRNLVDNIALLPAAYFMFRLNDVYNCPPQEVEQIAQIIFEPEAIRKAQRFAQYDSEAQRISLDSLEADPTEEMILNLDWLRAAQERAESLHPSNAQLNGADLDMGEFVDEGSLDTRAYHQRHYNDDLSDVDGEASQSNFRRWPQESNNNNRSNNPSSASRAGEGNDDLPHASAFVGGEV